MNARDPVGTTAVIKRLNANPVKIRVAGGIELPWVDGPVPTHIPPTCPKPVWDVLSGVDILVSRETLHVEYHVRAGNCQRRTNLTRSVEVKSPN